MVTYKWTTYKNGENYVMLKGTYYPIVNSWQAHYYVPPKNQQNKDKNN